MSAAKKEAAFQKFRMEYLAGYLDGNHDVLVEPDGNQDVIISLTNNR